MAAAKGFVNELASTQKFFNTTPSVFEPEDASFAPFPEHTPRARVGTSTAVKAPLDLPHLAL